MKLYFLILFSVLSVKSALALPCSYHFSELTKPEQRIVKTALSDLISFNKDIPVEVSFGDFSGVFEKMNNILGTEKPEVVQTIIIEALSPELISKIKDENPFFVEQIIRSLEDQIGKSEGKLLSLLEDILKKEDPTISPLAKETFILGIEKADKTREIETSLMELVKSETPDSSLRKLSIGVLTRLENPSNEVADLMTQILGEKEWNDSRVVSKLVFSHPTEQKKEIEKILKTYKPEDVEKIFIQSISTTYEETSRDYQNRQIKLIENLGEVDGGLGVLAKMLIAKKAEDSFLPKKIITLFHELRYKNPSEEVWQAMKQALFENPNPGGGKENALGFFRNKDEKLVIEILKEALEKFQNQDDYKLFTFYGKILGQQKAKVTQAAFIKYFNQNPSSRGDFIRYLGWRRRPFDPNDRNAGHRERAVTLNILKGLENPSNEIVQSIEQMSEEKSPEDSEINFLNALHDFNSIGPSHKSILNLTQAIEKLGKNLMNETQVELVQLLTLSRLPPEGLTHEEIVSDVMQPAVVDVFKKIENLSPDAVQEIEYRIERLEESPLEELRTFAREFSEKHL